MSSPKTDVSPAPSRPWLGGLSTAASYRNLLRELAVTEFKLKYEGSVLGYLWSFAKPLMLFGVLYFVFTRFIRLGSSVPHYSLQLLLAIVLWSYFTDSTMRAIGSIVDRGDLIRKVYFPRIIIVLAGSISSIITLAFNLVVILGFLLLSGIGLRPASLLFLPLVLQLYLLSLGCSLLLSALFVRFRDFRHIWEVGLQILFYGSPIIYPLEIVPRNLAWIAALNPIAQIIQDSRRVLVAPDTLTTSGLVHAPLLLVPYLVPVLLLGLGYWYFESAAARFAEDL